MRYFILLLCFFSTLGFANGATICAKDYTLVNNKCWRLIYRTLDTTTADEVCRTNDGGILVTLKTDDDNNGLLSFLNRTGIDRVWMGLTCTGLIESSCQWSDQTRLKQTDYYKFGSGYPNSAFGKCVFFSANGYPKGQWASGQCNEQLPFVCELPTTTPDHNSRCVHNYANNCYTRINDTASFTQSNDVCTQYLYQKSNLTSIHSFLENRYIGTLFKSEDVWIGGLAPSKNLIVWTDGSAYDYKMAFPSYSVKEGNCMKMVVGPKGIVNSWNGDDCAKQKVAICKRPVCEKRC